MSEKQTATGKAKRKPPSTAWPKGKSGNPKGRPRLGFSVRENLREIVQEIDPATKRQKLRIILDNLVGLAMRNSIKNLPAVNSVLDRLEPELGEPEKPITFADLHEIRSRIGIPDSGRDSGKD